MEKISEEKRHSVRIGGISGGKSGGKNTLKKKGRDRSRKIIFQEWKEKKKKKVAQRGTGPHGLTKVPPGTKNLGVQRGFRRNEKGLWGV